MEPQQFDALIRKLGTTRLSRLSALRGIAAGAVAAVAGIGLTSESEAARKKTKAKKAKKTKKAQQKSSTKTGGGGSTKPGGGNAGGGNLNCPAGGTNTPRIDADTLFGLDANGKLIPGCKTLAPITVPGDPGCTCTIELCLADDRKGISLGEDTTCNVTSLIVKGGSLGANDCKNLPKGEVCPTNPNGGGNSPDVSNVTACGISCCTPKTCADFTDGGCGYRDNECDGLTDFCGCPAAEGCTVDPDDTGDEGTCEVCPTLDDCTPETCEQILGGDLYGCEPVTCPDCEPPVGICVEGTSPKQCPKNSGDSFSCKIADSSVGTTGGVCDVSAANKPQGSLQVVCGEETKTCECQATTCTVYDKNGNVVEMLSKGQTSTACAPASCDD